MDIQKRLEQLEFVHRTADVASWVWDIAGDSVQWFGDAEGLLGLKPGSHSGRFGQYLSLLHPEDAPAARRTLVECLRGERPTYRTEERLLGPDGDVRWLETFGQAEYAGDGRATRMAGVVRDVTQRRVSEDRIRDLAERLEERVRERTMQLESANRELEEFSMTVSHDLLAPVQTVRLFAQMLQQDCAAELSEKCRHLAGRIERAALRMNEMVGALLELSRIGRVALAMQPVNLGEIAAEVVDDLRLAHRFAGEVEVARLQRCLGDARLLRQVLQNLVGNAMKFSRHSAAPRIELGSAALGGDRIGYWIRDNGCGFDMRHAARLFDAFQRLHGQRQYEGAGVGLATVRRIVNRHGGEVRAESTPGGGATFYFTLSAA
jgi:PAS domain S-box-containing protein